MKDFLLAGMAVAVSSLLKRVSNSRHSSYTGLLGEPRMFHSGRSIQAVILFSAALGVLFLWQAAGLLPGFVFDFIAFGWVLFVVDSALTFVRPRISYLLAFVLAILALSASLPQSAHWAFIQEGDLVPAAIFITGSIAQILLLILVPYHFVRGRRSS